MNINPEWLRRIPGNDFNGAVSFLDSLGWNVSFIRSDNQRKVFTGDRLLYSSSNEQEVEAFILGMALGLAVLPGEILDRIREIIGD
jgi:hypothetical protein